MDYNKVKLGLVDRFKVWRVKREAEKTRAWRDNIEHEISEVDYSEAEKLEADLLEQKRIKKATRDARKLFKRYNNKEKYGYDAWDGLGEDEFVEEYLIEHGLKQQALPESTATKKHNFMEQYPTEKSEEEIAYEKTNIQPKIYYKINDTEYELPYTFAIRMQNMDKMLPLEEQSNGKYVIIDDKMNPYDKYDMLKNMLDITSMYAMSWINVYISQVNDEKLDERAKKLCRKIDLHEYFTKQLVTEGKVDKANTILTRRIEDMLKFEQELLQSEQEEVRE